MALPWIRIDTNLAAHDKIIALTSDTSPHRWRAAFSYVCGIAWSGAAGTDGRIPRGALPMIHGTTHTADLLVKHSLWETESQGYRIHNFDRYQEVSSITSVKRAQARRAACIRWHGPGCWDDITGCSQS